MILGPVGRAALARALVAGAGGALLGAGLTMFIWYVDEVRPPLAVFVVPPVTVALLLALPAAASAWIEAWAAAARRTVAGPLLALLAGAGTTLALVVEGIWLEGVSRTRGDPDGGFQALGRVLEEVSTPRGPQVLGVVVGLALSTGVPQAAVLRRRLLGERGLDVLGRGVRDTLLAAVAGLLVSLPLFVVAGRSPSGAAAAAAGLAMGWIMGLVAFGWLLAPAWVVLLAAADRLHARLEARAAAESDGG